MLSLPVFIFIGAVNIWTGATLIRSTEFRDTGIKMLGWLFIIWGIHKLDYPFLRPVEWFAPWGYLISSLISLSIAIGMILVYFRSTRNNLEREIEERKKLMDELRRTKDRLEAIYEATPDMMFIHGKDGFLIDVNDNVLKTYGSTREEMLNTSLEEFMGAGFNLERAMDKIRLTLEGSPQDFEWLSRKSSGEEFPVYVQLRKLELINKEGNKEMGVLANVRDITNHKKMVAQLTRAQKMEAVGQLAGGIAHDFNNILTAIIGFAHSMKVKINNDSPFKYYLDKIIYSSQRASELTQSLLAFSRKQIINPEPVHICSIISNAEKLLSRLIGEDIIINIGTGGDDLIIMADTGQIEQVLMNLATNAQDSMRAGGTLTIRTELSRIDDEYIRTRGYGTPGDYALITVSDTGTGMDEETVEKIFEPFFTTKEFGKGTGLGLAMVYGIVKQHNGFINVYSREGEGTTFKIYFPIAKADVEKREPAFMHRPEPGSETILLVEDNTLVRQSIKINLEEFGYTIIEACDGVDGIHKFKENTDRIQMVILDVIMPKKNGKEVYDEIVKLQPAIKSLFMSGYSSDKISEKGILDEGLSFISKPIKPDDLLRKVRDILDGK